MRRRIYLDANAGAPLVAEVREGMIAALDQAGNPSSVHAEGRRARQQVEAARSAVAASVGAPPENVIFTSGGTEAAMLALSPRLLCGGKAVAAGRLYVGATEHPCVLSGGRFPPEITTVLPVHRSGLVDLESMEHALAAHDHGEGAPLVALMLANNETGAIHPVANAAAVVKRHGGYLFCDAVQALGRIPLDVAALGADFVVVSAHKIGGPQGVGALILRDEGTRPEPLLTGGGQERKRRAGTENVTAIVGFGIAASLVAHHLTDAGRLSGLRARLERGIRTISPEARIVSAEVDRIPNTTLFVAPGVAAETAVIALDLEGIAVSAGAACSSGKVAASPVLEAMGFGTDEARSGIRVSLPATVEAADIDAFLAAWRIVHSRIGQSRAA